MLYMSHMQIELSRLPRKFGASQKLSSSSEKKKEEEKMVKPACFDSKGMKKGAWSEEEDNKLRDYVLRYGHWNWRLLPKYAGLARCGKSCRLRWVNYLKPGVKKGDFTKQEEELIVKLQQQLGNKWSAIAAKFPGRTDSEIKNYWYRRIEKRCNKKNTKGHSQKNQENSEAVSENEKSAEITPISSHTSQTESSASLSASEKHEDTAQSMDTNSYSGSRVDPQLDFWVDSLSFPEDTTYSYQTEDFPLIPEQEFVLHYDELSTSDSSSSFLSSALDWINSGDDHIAEPGQGNFWSESVFESDGFNNSLSIQNNCYDPLFQYIDDGAYNGCDRFEDLLAFNECNLI